MDQLLNSLPLSAHQNGPASSSTKPTQLRLRIFAGPNGSGKSTVIESIRAYRTNERALDFGYYVNSDQIVLLLKDQGLAFSDFELEATANEFAEIAKASGLVSDSRFSEEDFRKSFRIKGNHIRWALRNQKDMDHVSATRSVEALAQITANFIHKKLLRARKKFSLETVFSHPDKIELMREAVEAGYKVYLYFVATESPEINKFRVLAREEKGGHHVHPERIEQRYQRSLGLLFDASQHTYQTYFIDNSADNREANFFASFKVVDGVKQWQRKPEAGDSYPGWFFEHYYDKMPVD